MSVIQSWDLLIVFIFVEAYFDTAQGEQAQGMKSSRLYFQDLERALRLYRCFYLGKTLNVR